MTKPRLLVRQAALCCLFICSAAVAARAEDAAALVQKGFYLQVHEGDPAGAAAVFEQVASDSAAPAELKREAENRLGQCREDIAAADLARLMPPEAIAYVEINRPGDQIVRLAKMMGLVREPGTESASTTNGPAAPGIPLGPGFVFPADFNVSPALAAELKKFRGAALAITGLDDRMQKMPEGVLVIHPGDSDLVRGLLETGVQLIEPAESIANFKTYRFHDHQHQFWLTVTKRLLIAGTKREAVAATVERLRNPKAESLAARPAFKTHEAERGKGLLFAYVDGHETAQRLRTMMKGREAAMVATLLDLEHLDSLTLSAGVTDESVQIVGRMNLKPGHHNVAYNLIRTAPFTGRALNSVPNGTAGVVLVGLNPATPAQNGKPSNQGPVEVTGMDIGREIFANIEEVAFFVLPTAAKSAGSSHALPAMAAVFAVNDPAKSEELWNQILSIVAMAGFHDTHPRDITIEGTKARLYHFQGAPPIVVVRTSERELIVGTEDAASAALRASRSHDSIRNDASYSKALAKLTPTSSKAVLVDAGRAMQIARAFSSGGNTSEMDMAVVAVKDLHVSLVTDEARDSLTIRIEASGLPNVPSIIKMIANQPHSTAKK
jgi:hypothetical protein